MTRDPMQTRLCDEYGCEIPLVGFAHTRDDGAFGVPLFIIRGERFWGNDRLDWLLRAVARSQGREVTDLAAEPLAPVYSP